VTVPAQIEIREQFEKIAGSWVQNVRGKQCDPLQLWLSVSDSMQMNYDGKQMKGVPPKKQRTLIELQDNLKLHKKTSRRYVIP
jgi:hypothetical protein